MRTKSKKPGKQRLYEYKIPKHEAHKLLSAPLSKKLREDRGFRSLPIREGDEVQIVRGDFTGKKGKVNRTEPSKARIYIDGIGGEKTDASEIAIPIHPSNVVITKMSTRDRRRMEIINRRVEAEDQKIDIDSVLAEIEAEEEEDLIDFEDEELDELDEEALLEEELAELEEEEFELVEEEDEDLEEEEDEQ